MNFYDVVISVPVFSVVVGVERNCEDYNKRADTDSILGDEILEQVTDGAEPESCDYDRLADNY